MLIRLLNSIKVADRFIEKRASDEIDGVNEKRGRETLCSLTRKLLKQDS